MDIDDLSDEELLHELLESFFDLAIAVHKVALENGGGVPGVKDEHMIRSALGRAYQTFEGQIFYPSVIEKAGCLLHGLLSNHGFHDANKRTAWLFCNMFLYIRSYSLDLSEDYQWYDKLAEMVDQRWDVSRVIEWLRQFAAEHDSKEDALKALRHEI